MNRKVRIVLLGEAEKAYKHLNSITKEQLQDDKTQTSEIQLLRSINQKIDLIKSNPFYGDNIAKKKLPKLPYDISNLWRVELTGYWRMLYTIKGDEVQIVCFILEIINHKKYDKLFRYKKK